MSESTTKRPAALPGTLSLTELKHEARAIAAEAAAVGAPISHCAALERLAARYGMRNWNSLRALVAAPVATGPRGMLSRLRLGGRVSGLYLGQPFCGNLMGLDHSEKGAARIVILFDTPVDVVKSTRFSGYRSRVTAVIGKGGESREKTSDGMPQMKITGVLG